MKERTLAIILRQHILDTMGRKVTIEQAQRMWEIVKEKHNGENNKK